MPVTVNPLQQVQVRLTSSVELIRAALEPHAASSERNKAK